MYDKKLTNPKDAIGSAKLPLHLVPDTLAVCCATALLEGALKYGAHNWRAAGVRASIYRSALQRHIAKWWNGENHDPVTGVHHLDNAIACLAILRDAELVDKLTDDRPPSAPMSKFIDKQVELVAHLKALFANESPRHWSIADDAEIAEPLPSDHGAAVRPPREGYPAERCAVCRMQPCSCCNCYAKAPTIPVYRNPGEHLANCPAACR